MRATAWRPDTTRESWISPSIVLVLGAELIMISRQVPLPAEPSQQLLKKNDLSLLFLTCVCGWLCACEFR